MPVALFALAIIVSLSSPFVLSSWPSLAPYYLIIGFVIAVTLLGSRILAGDCFMTYWEKRILRKEGAEPYDEQFVVHYAERWFGINISSSVNVGFQTFLYALPLAEGLRHWM